MKYNNFKKMKPIKIKDIIKRNEYRHAYLRYMSGARDRKHAFDNDIRRRENMTSNSVSIEMIKEVITPILRCYPVNKAILFGSYAKREANNNSDIDLYIDTNSKLKGLDFVGLLETLVETFGKDVDLIDKSHIEPDSLIIQEIENGGTVIYERSEDY